jgi:hypothetical protein
MTKTEWAINLLDSEYFKELFSELKEIEVNKIVSSTPENIGERESAYQMISAYNQIYSSIEAMAADKKIIEKRWKIW